MITSPDRACSSTMGNMSSWITAIGFGGWQTFQWVYWQAGNIQNLPTPHSLFDWAYLICFVALCWAWATVLMRLRSPRPVWWRVGRQPGFAACLAVALYSMIRWICSLLLRVGWSTGHPPFWPWIVHRFVGSAWFFSRYIAVAVAWATLVLSGNWKPEASWIDRLGRALGVGWIVAAFALAIFDR